MWWVKEGMGICLVIFVYIIIFSIDFSYLLGAYYNEIFEDRSVGHVFMFLVMQVIIFLMIWSHLSWMLTNPGSLPRDQEQLDQNLMSKESSLMYDKVKHRLNFFTNQNNPPENGNNIRNEDLKGDDPEGTGMKLKQLKSLCETFNQRWVTWNTFKPPRTHHWSICDWCIARMDHHCPWMNNCIGYSNMKQFILFIMYVTIGCFYLLTTWIIQIITWKNSDDWDRIGGFLLGWNIYWISVSALFLIFGTWMTVQLCENTAGDTTTIDRMKATEFKHRVKPCTNISNAFGNQPVYLWFLPLRVNKKVIIESHY